MQELGPNGANELPATVGEEPSGCAEVEDDMADKGFADCTCGVVAGRDEDDVLGKAIHKDNQELVALVWRKRAHNVDGQRIPWALELDGAGYLLAVVHNRCSTGTGGNFEWSPSRCGGWLCGSTGRGRPSTKLGHRGG